jgi:hypothetical protein
VTQSTLAPAPREPDPDAPRRWSLPALLDFGRSPILALLRRLAAPRRPSPRACLVAHAWRPDGSCSTSIARAWRRRDCRGGRCPAGDAACVGSGCLNRAGHLCMVVVGRFVPDDEAALYRIADRPAAKPEAGDLQELADVDGSEVAA